MDDVIKLISQEFSENKYGVQVPELNYREIFCEIHDITRAEYYQTGRNGLNDSFMAKIATVEYNGESLVEYNGQTYAIYRKYDVPGTDYTELYIERKGGTNGQESHS